MRCVSSQSRQLDLELASAPRWGGARSGAGRKPGGLDVIRPAKGASRIAASVSCYAEGGEGCSLAPVCEANRGAGAKLAGVLRAVSISSRSLLDPTRPRAHDCRSGKRAGSRVWAEVDRRAFCAWRQPRLSSRRPCARRSLPHSYPADSARGAKRDRLCASQCAPPPCEAGPSAARDRLHRPGIVGAMVLGLARGAPPSRDPPAVAAARTWLLTFGWRKRGLIDTAEVPGAGAKTWGRNWADR